MEEDPGGAIIAMKAKDQRGTLSPSRGEAMEEDPGGAIITMKAKDWRENLSPSRGRQWRRKHKGENLSSSLSVAPECHRRGIIAAVIVFINITIIITILISFTRSTLPNPAVIPT